jgi:hypothetical protein
MPEDERQLRLREVAVDDVKVGPAHPTRMNAQPDLPGPRLGLGDLLEPKRLPLRM